MLLHARISRTTSALLVAAISAGGSLSFYAFTTYLQKFLVNTSGFSKPAATQAVGQESDGAVPVRAGRVAEAA